MNKGTKLSIRLKITVLLALLSTLFISILYFSIEKIITTDIAEIERQKAEMIAKTIEPTLAMNHFMQLEEDNREFAQKVMQNEDIVGIGIYFGNQPFYLHRPMLDEGQLFKIVYPIRDVMLHETIGNIELHYTKKHYNKTVETLYRRFAVVTLTVIALLLIVYSTIRYLFRPLDQITESIAAYRIGDSIDFTGVRRDKETNGVITILSDLIERVNRHNQVMEEKQAELREAREIADAASESKSMFLANMSHEIRTPMNGILGFSKLLEQTGLNTKQQRYNDIINASANALLGIINDILDFSKLESGKFELDYSRWNPFIEFEKVTALFTARMDEKRITFIRHIDPDVPECIEADLLRLQQVITNLLGNAIKFTPEEGTITFYVKRVKGINGSVVLRIGVRDSGIGIEKSKQAHIFDAFSQADSSTTRQFGGTGLGLSISSHLVSLMGGKIELVSEIGEGSEFYFDISVNRFESEHSLSVVFKKLQIVVFDDENNGGIGQATILPYLTKLRIPYRLKNLGEIFSTPGNGDIYILFCNANQMMVEYLLTEKATTIVICKEDHGWLMQHNPRLLWISDIDHNLSGLYNALLKAAMNEQDIHRPAVGAAGGMQVSGKVLVAEDNEVNQILIEEILSQRGLEYVIVPNGQEALEQLENERFDIIFMDINMPVMGGIEAVQRIKARGVTTPVIALTANAMEGDRERYLEDGFDNYLTKPIVLEQFDSLIRGYLMDAVADNAAQEAVDVSKEEVSLVDMERIRRELKFSDQLIMKLMKAYLDSCDAPLDKLKEAVEHEDIDQIMMNAHSIKGAASNLCLHSVVELARIMEENSRMKHRIDYSALTAQLTVLNDEVKAQIREIIKKQDF